jgi:hypothetical protein
MYNILEKELRYRLKIGTLNLLAMKTRAIRIIILCVIHVASLL